MRGFRRSVLVVSVVLALLLATFGIGYAITNGQPDGDDHPYVGLLVFDDENGPSWRCSGSLLSPTVVLTAGHCTDGAVAARIWMNEIVAGNTEYPRSGSTSYDGTAYTIPGFNIGGAGGIGGFAYRDVGIVVLSEPVPTSVVSEYAELPDEGLVDTLMNKAPVDLVGYGVQQQLMGGGPPAWTGLRNRMYAPSQFVSGQFSWSDEFVRLSMNPGGDKGGSCFGDSGGPDLLGGTDTVIGVNSYVTNSNCSGVGYSQRVDLEPVLEWINSFLD